MVETFLGHVMLEHAVMTFQQMSDVAAEIPAGPHSGLFDRPADGRRAHNLENSALRLGDFEAPILEVVLRAERGVSGAAQLLHFPGNIHHLQSMFVIVGRHGESVSPSGRELTRGGSNSVGRVIPKWFAGVS